MEANSEIRRPRENAKMIPARIWGHARGREGVAVVEANVAIAARRER